MLSGDTTERRLQVSEILLLLGILVEMLCIVWTRPIAFIVFVAIGGSFSSLGILAYLMALISRHHNEP